MMKVKTNTLTGDALDYAVSCAEGNVPTKCEHRGHVWFVLGKPSVFEKPIHIPGYSCSAAGDDIIDRELIATTPLWHNAGHDSATGYWYWQADVLGPENIDDSYQQFGPTRRIAAMRCFVASKLGDEIEIPGELL